MHAALFPAPAVLIGVVPEALIFLGHYGGQDYFAIPVPDAQAGEWWLSRDKHLSFEKSVAKRVQAGSVRGVSAGLRPRHVSLASTIAVLRGLRQPDAARQGRPYAPV